MNAPRKKSALQRYGGMPVDEAIDLLKTDENNYTEKEQEEIISALKEAAGDKPAPQTPAPNKPINLSGFEYSGRLEGENFRVYNRIIMGLLDEEKHDFECYQVRPIKAPRYEGVDGSPMDIIGIDIIDPRPMNTTRIPVKMAKEFNGFLKEGKNFFTIEGGHFHNVSSSAGSFGKYYLLKKS